MTSLPAMLAQVKRAYPPHDLADYTTTRKLQIKLFHALVYLKAKQTRPKGEYDALCPRTENFGL